MPAIELDDGLKVFVFYPTGVGLKELRHSTLQFPGGEVHVRFDASDSPLDRGNPLLPGYATIHAKLREPKDIVVLLMLTDALRRLIGYDVPIKLRMPYVPYARQDRVAVAGESLSIHVFAALINTQKYSEVHIFDPHSDVTPALFERCVTEKAFEHVAYAVTHLRTKGPGEIILVAPDVGARKRVAAMAEKMGVRWLPADKDRNPLTGQLSDARIIYTFQPEPGAQYLMVDDICDGGRTFLELARVLVQTAPHPGTINLYVSHGIFSNGLQELNARLDTIYVVHPFIRQESEAHFHLVRI